MNREIKFRGKCSAESKYPGEWVDGGLLVPKYAKNNEVLILKALYDSCIITYHVDKDTVCEFTGLCDKDGKEIYESDILQLTIEKGKVLCIVTWNIEVGAWCLKLNGSKLEGSRTLGEWLRDSTTEIEMIGNIYDNKELLEE